MELIPGIVTETGKIVKDVALAKTGDKGAFVRLIKEYEVSLYRVAAGILQNEEDAKDAYQDTVAKAYKGIANLKKNEFFKTWLIRIMINECKLIMRRRRHTISFDKIKDIETEDNYEKLELWEAVNLLEEELRTPIVLYYYEDLKQEEIASVLGIPSGTVKSRLLRAKERLRTLLDIKL